MLTYQLTQEGYIIYRDGVVLITQECIPGIPGVHPFLSDEAKQNYAEAEIDFLNSAAAPVEQAQ